MVTAGILAEAARPVPIILFGSHARGDVCEDSDIDLSVNNSSKTGASVTA